MNDRNPSRSPARFVVPIGIIGCVACAFALYAWGGIGPAEEQLIALATVARIGGWVPARPVDPLVAEHREVPAMAASAVQ